MGVHGEYMGVHGVHRSTPMMYSHFLQCTPIYSYVLLSTPMYSYVLPCECSEPQQPTRTIKCRVGAGGEAKPKISQPPTQQHKYIRYYNKKEVVTMVFKLLSKMILPNLEKVSHNTQHRRHHAFLVVAW